MPTPPPGTTSDDAASQPIDLPYLRRQTFDDRALQAELLDLFARQAKGIIEDLAATGGATGAARLRRADLLHTLSGSARAVGAWDVATGAQKLEVEERGIGPVKDGRDADLAALDQSVHRARRAIADIRAAAPADAGVAPPVARR